MSAVEPRRVLIATAEMSAPSGTDLYTRDLALALLRRGWLPIVYTSSIGQPAEELRQATIPVVSDVSALQARPDVIHGHHALETLTMLARFRDVPALFVCHDAVTWHSAPPASSHIRTWVAVDRNCRDRMMFEHGVPEGSIHVLANAVDLERFRRRGPLPSRPARALVFNNTAVESNYVATIRAACSQRNIELDVLGSAAGSATWNPEAELPRYDLVFARGRSALEAAAVGAAVVPCDLRGMAGMLTSASLAAMRALNFGMRTLQIPVTVANVLAEIDRYDPVDATAVSDAIRASAAVDVLADQYIELYESLIAGGPVRQSAEEDLAELAVALSGVSRRIPLQFSLSSRKRAILNSRALVGPVKLARWLKRRLDV